ncbi:MAG: DJ-1/PfpI family protein [Deltaproteobacteria bacterium]|nr:DJ-1/PfpI family protein [Deltaproteobacteria bacterium]
MGIRGKKIAILIESGFYEPEINYYNFRFKEEGAELHFMSRLWGQSGISFKGNENHGNTMWVDKTFEGMTDEQLASYAAVIVPAGFVSDRLRYTDDVNKLSPATEFLKRAFANPNILKGIICHGLWLVAPAPELVRGRRLTTHNNLHGDAVNMGAIYVNEDVVVDGDLVTGRSGGHAHLFARKIIDILNERG